MDGINFGQIFNVVLASLVVYLIKKIFEVERILISLVTKIDYLERELERKKRGLENEDY